MFAQFFKFLLSNHLLLHLYLLIHRMQLKLFIFGVISLLSTVDQKIGLKQLLAKWNWVCSKNWGSYSFTSSLVHYLVNNLILIWTQNKPQSIAPCIVALISHDIVDNILVETLIHGLLVSVLTLIANKITPCVEALINCSRVNHVLVQTLINWLLVSPSAFFSSGSDEPPLFPLPDHHIWLFRAKHIF